MLSSYKILRIQFWTLIQFNLKYGTKTKSVLILDMINLKYRLFLHSTHILQWGWQKCCRSPGGWLPCSCIGPGSCRSAVRYSAQPLRCCRWWHTLLPRPRTRRPWTTALSAMVCPPPNIKKLVLRGRPQTTWGVLGIFLPRLTTWDFKLQYLKSLNFQWIKNLQKNSQPTLILNKIN